MSRIEYVEVLAWIRESVKAEPVIDIDDAANLDRVLEAVGGGQSER